MPSTSLRSPFAAAVVSVLRRPLRLVDDNPEHMTQSALLSRNAALRGCIAEVGATARAPAECLELMPLGRQFEELIMTITLPANQVGCRSGDNTARIRSSFFAACS